MHLMCQTCATVSSSVVRHDATVALHRALQQKRFLNTSTHKKNDLRSAGQRSTEQWSPKSED